MQKENKVTKKGCAIEKSKRDVTTVMLNHRVSALRCGREEGTDDSTQRAQWNTATENVNDRFTGLGACILIRLTIVGDGGTYGDYLIGSNRAAVITPRLANVT